MHFLVPWVKQIIQYMIHHQVESTFYEVYRPILMGLQNILTNTDENAGLPMVNYIVECDMKLNPPR